MNTHTHKNRTEIATLIHEQMMKVRPTFELSTAGVFAIVDRGGEDYEIVELVRHADVYEAITEAIFADYDYDGITVGYALETTGWAAPLNNDGEVTGGAPSAHPERRRVRLTAINLANVGAASVLEFADDPGELITDQGEATGSLAVDLSRLTSSRLAE
jgi:hypothetical protein